MKKSITLYVSDINFPCFSSRARAREQHPQQQLQQLPVFCHTKNLFATYITKIYLLVIFKLLIFIYIIDYSLLIYYEANTNKRNGCVR